MWMQSRCDFRDLSFGDDIMNPMVCCDTGIPDANTVKIKKPKNFGHNRSKIMTIKRISKLYSWVFRHDNDRYNGNCFTFSTARAIKVNLGSHDEEEQLWNADLEFLLKVNMVANYISAQNAIYEAAVRFKPTPKWYCDFIHLRIDANGNGSDAEASEMILAVLDSDDANDLEYLEKLKECLLLIAISPRNYIIKKGGRRISNRDIANKLVRTANEVCQKITHYDSIVSTIA